MTKTPALVHHAPSTNPLFQLNKPHLTACGSANFGTNWTPVNTDVTCEPCQDRLLERALYRVWSEIASDAMAAVGQQTMRRAEVIEIVGDRAESNLSTALRRWWNEREHDDQLRILKNAFPHGRY